ncbi:28270_t:CDS:10, partial [Gigaspora margarita]
MNQQRGRRFRTAKDAAEAIRRAESKGESLPKEAPFDSNCITPGTEFMAKLSRQLEYFINKKVSEDANWRGIQIVLSGHGVPGEGEHKIMEYIRNAKAQSDYNPNVRHCLYGLDADLIMLGLLSHDPHFALLREEVTFGPSSKKKKHGRIESQNFYLMHLSLLREYLDLEFSTLRESLPFEYNLERIIDDFILLALFVGNDFIPHLPNLHIAEGALGLMFQVYKKVLPQAGGYINDGGILDLERLEMMFKELSVFEKDIFEGEFEDLKWFKGKQRKNLDQIEKDKKKKKLVMTPRQQEIFRQMKELVESRSEEPIHFPVDYPARERTFIKNLAKELAIQHSIEYHEDGGDKHVYVEYDSEDESEEEMKEMREKIFKKYENAEVIEDEDVEAFEEKERQQYEAKYMDWKKEYYLGKMNIDYNDQEKMDGIVGSYVEGLQWVLHYYYNGVASWGWFYSYHYSPKISDLYDLKRFDIKFDLGRPFKPFEQLMGVLPEGSKRLLPSPYQDLMTNPDSPIIDFYPKDFDLDMNGKKQDWEAVVNIPFIDQKRLVSALDSKEHLLTDDEKQRNKFEESLMFTYDQSLNEKYPSSLPDFFPDINHCHCRMETYNLPTLHGLKLNKGLCDGVKLGMQAMAGFPSLETIPHTGMLSRHGVNVFNSESRNETMVITLENEFADMKAQDLAMETVGKRIFVGWPFLQEASVQAISDENYRYELTHQRQDFVRHYHSARNTRNHQEIIKIQHRQDMFEHWRRKADKLEQNYNKRYGTITGTVEIIVHVLMLKGLRRLSNGALVKEYANPNEEMEYAIQTTVNSVECEDPRYEEKPATQIAEEFPIETQIFFLGSLYYGCPGIVVSNAKKNLAVKLVIDPNNSVEPDFGKKIANDFDNRVKYQPSFQVAKRLSMSGLTLSKLTASLYVICKSTDQRVNLGLNLKFEAKKQKVLGYTRKSRDSGWEYSEKAMQILAQYKEKFPEFIQALEEKHKDEIYSAEDFYPKEEAVSKIHAIKEWLRTVEVRDFEKVSLDAERLDKEAIAKIEQAAIEFTNKKSFRKLTIQKIPRDVLLKPAHASTRLQGQKFNLGDRVVFVQDSGNVPIAAKGTVVGIEKNNIDVVFDASFMSGSTLGDRCSQYRGMTVPGSALLNLTDMQFIDHRTNYSNGIVGPRSINYASNQPRSSLGQNGHSNHHNSYYGGRVGNSKNHNMYLNSNHSINGSQNVRAIMSSNRARGDGYVPASSASLSQRTTSQMYGLSNKYIIQNHATSHYRNTFNGNIRGGNGNGFLSRGNAGG